MLYLKAMFGRSKAGESLAVSHERVKPRPSATSPMIGQRGGTQPHWKNASVPGTSRQASTPRRPAYRHRSLVKDLVTLHITVVAQL